jgi:endo-1,4-beta-xylanase
MNFHRAQLLNLHWLAILVMACMMMLAPHRVMAALPAGQALLPERLDALKPVGATFPEGLATEVAVAGQPFTKAWRINTYGKEPNKFAYALEARISEPLRKGDVVWISFKARRIEAKTETGEAYFNMRFEQRVDGKYKWPSYVERGVSIGNEWTETSIPFVIDKDLTPADVALVFHFEKAEQHFELSPIRFINFGNKVNIADIPRSVIRYVGDEPDAAWRAEAAQRIENIRKGDLVVQVVNEKGQAIEGAEVAVRMTRNAFHWGTAVNSKQINDDTPDAKKSREILTKYFNRIVYENEVKSKYWGRQDPNNKGAQIKKANQWLRANGFTIRGHVMVWPSWRHSPHLLSLKDDPAALRSKILSDIDEIGTILKGEFDEWDVINEPYNHHDLIDILGKPEMVTWFKAARKVAPNTKLFLNDYTTFQSKEASQAFWDYAKYLIDNGAPIDAIGEQTHIGGTPPPIPYVIERLDHFAKLGLPLEITEFDISSNDDEYKARYLTDFMTVLYSHPNSIGFVQWGFWAGSHWWPDAALWDKDWNIRKHGQAYVDLVTKTWWTNFDGKTAADGSTKLRGFTGDYEVTVRYNGKTTTQKVSLSNAGNVLKIQLR